MSSFRPDLVIENAQGYPIAAIEVKSWQNLSKDDAIEMHRNLLNRGLPADIPYFLLLSQDKGYLWYGSERKDPNEPPIYEFPMEKVVARYSKKEPRQRLYQTELSLLVLQWLTHLSTKPQDISAEPENTLAKTGFNDSIKDGFVLIEEAI